MKTSQVLFAIHPCNQCGIAGWSQSDGCRLFSGDGKSSLHWQEDFEQIYNSLTGVLSGLGNLSSKVDSLLASCNLLKIGLLHGKLKPVVSGGPVDEIGRAHV